MADEPLISREEVASVLDKDEPEKAPQPEEQDESNVYSLRRPVNIAPADVEAARKRAEGFAVHLASIFGRELDVEIGVEVQGFGQQQVRDAFDSDSGEKWVLSFEQSRSGGIALILEPPAALTLVELALGGTGNTQAAARQPTPLEKRVMANLAKAGLVQMSQRTGVELTSGNFSMGGVSPTLASAGEMVGIALLKLSFGEADRAGMLMVTSGLLRPQESSSHSDVQPPVGPMASRLVKVPVEVRPVLVAGQVALNDLTKLKKDDVLQLDVHEHDALDLRVQGQTVFKGRVQREEQEVAFEVAWRRSGYNREARQEPAPARLEEQA